MKKVKRDVDVEKITKEIYEKALDVWFRVSPYTQTNRGHPGVPYTYNGELGYVEAAIRVLKECQVGLMEKRFPKLKEVRLEQEQYWDVVFPGCK